MKNTIPYRKPVSADTWIILIIFMFIGGFVLWIFLKNTGPTKTNRDVALDCTSDMATQFHIHPTLKIMIDGEEESIPANIGITSGCMHPLHTHDSSGLIHIESPEKRDFTLADFFAVWGRSFDKDHVIGEIVNGKPTTDYENTVLKDHDQIIINYQKK